MMAALLLISVLSIFVIIFAIRNNQVLEARMRILDLIWKLNINELPMMSKKAIENCELRYKYFESVSFNEMVYKFWKPISSFYDLKRIVNPNPNHLKVIVSNTRQLVTCPSCGCNMSMTKNGCWICLNCGEQSGKA